MPYAVKIIILAAILYTVVIGIEQIKRKLKKWMVIIFTIALSSDLIGTSIMTWQANTHIYPTVPSLSTHAISGFSALIIMLIHFIFALKALGNKKYEILFTRFSWFAWLIWMFAFSSGLLI